MSYVLFKHWNRKKLEGTQDLTERGKAYSFGRPENKIKEEIHFGRQAQGFTGASS